MRSRTDLVIGAVMCLVAASITAYYVQGCNDCNRRGGVFVRQALGYACVEPRP